MAKKEHKYFVLYSNNTFESLTKLDDTIERLLKNGVISLIYDIENNIVTGNTPEGIKKMNVTHIE